MLNHHLAGLTAYAYHAPKKMPKFKPASEKAKGSAKAEPVNSEWARAQVSAFFIGRGAKVKGRG